jgi:hypothetical protein
MEQQKKPSVSSRLKEYARLCAQLAGAGWISEGYVQDRGGPAGAALVIPGPAKSKARPSVSPCPGSSMSGLSERLPIGARSSALCGKCSGSAGRNSSNPCPIPAAESGSAGKCRGYDRRPGHTRRAQTHGQTHPFDIRPLPDRANNAFRPNNHNLQRDNSSEISPKCQLMEAISVL